MEVSFLFCLKYTAYKKISNFILSHFAHKVTVYG